MSLAKAKIINIVTREEIPVMFNPEEYAISRSARYTDAHVPGLEAPIPEYGHGFKETLNMDLFFDTYETGEDVRKFTEKIAKLLEPDQSTDKDEPPVCLFAWGSLTFEAQLENVTKKFTMFNSQGIPVRATLSVTFRGHQDLDFLLAKNPNRSLGHSKAHIVKEGETLSQISWQAYRDPGLWRAIADQNHIVDPRKLQAGQVLLIPPRA